MADDPRPPYPGAAPDVPSFPFAQSRAASAAIEAIIDELQDVVDALGTAMGDLDDSPFEGVFADYYRGDNDASTAAIEARITQLDGHLDDLGQLRSDAQEAIEAAEAAHGRWQSRNLAWNQWHARNQVTVPR